MTAMRAAALSLLLLSGTASAMTPCEERLTDSFVVIAAEASRLYTLPMPSLRFVPASFRWAGVWDTPSRTVLLSLSLCDDPAPMADSTIAHELGHAITDMLYPDLRSGLAHEQQADLFGSHLLDRSESDALLPLLDNLCRRGHKRSCNKSINWAYGLTH